jgi:hypothetical protein
MTRVQATLRVPGTMPLPALLTLIQNVEAAGFDGVGILDHHARGSARNVRTPSAAAGIRATKYTRHAPINLSPRRQHLRDVSHQRRNG